MLCTKYICLYLVYKSKKLKKHSTNLLLLNITLVNKNNYCGDGIINTTTIPNPSLTYRQSIMNDTDDEEPPRNYLPDIPQWDGEIVGLLQDSNGRSCESHEVCGLYVRVNDLITLESRSIKINNNYSPGICARRVRSGVSSCVIGFIPTSHLSYWEPFCGWVAQILELYHHSDNTAKRAKICRNYGVASFQLIGPRTELILDGDWESPF